MLHFSDKKTYVSIDFRLLKYLSDKKTYVTNISLFVRKMETSEL